MKCTTGPGRSLMAGACIRCTPPACIQLSILSSIEPVTSCEMHAPVKLQVHAAF